MQAFWDTYLGTAPPRDTPEYERYIDEAFVRGMAHLREAGIGHAPYAEKRMAQLTGQGDHPFNAFVRALAQEGTYVCFIPAHTEGSFAAGVVRRPNGSPVLVLGTRLLLELDANAPSIAHERIHVVLPKAVGESPHGATFTAREGSHLPGAPHWDYALHQAGDEPQAYLAGIVMALRKVAEAAKAGEPAKAEESFHEAFRDVVAGLETALRNLATAKQTLGALRQGALTRLIGETLGADEVGFGFTRRNGRRYDVVFRHGGLESALAADAALARPGEVGPATRARLVTHFEWQLRAAREELAIYRVLGQAMHLAARLPRLEVQIIDAAIALATTERAAASADATPISYEEALSLFNERVAA